MNRIALIAAGAMLAVPGTGLAADLVIETPEAVVAAADWSGFYAGGHVGRGAGEFSFVVAPGADIDGWLAGLQAGYNFQSGGFVLGIEGDVSWADIEYVQQMGPAELRLGVDWLASLRGRAGYALDTVLLYGTAGVEAAGATSRTWNPAPSPTYEAGATHLGLVAGLGAEIMVTDGVSLRGEYLYHAIGGEDYTFATTPPTTVGYDYSFQTLTVGANFHF